MTTPERLRFFESPPASAGQEAIDVRAAEIKLGVPDGAAWDRRGYVLRRILAVCDLAGLAAAFAVVLLAQSALGRPPESTGDLIVFFAMIPAWFALAHLLGLYHESERRIDHSVVDELAPVFLATTVWSWFLLMVNAAVLSGPNEVLPLGLLWIAAVLLIVGFRALARWQSVSKHWFRQPVIVVGSSDDIERVMVRLDRHPEFGVDVARAIRIGAERPGDGDPPESEGIGPRLSPGDVVALVQEARVSRVIVTEWPDLQGRTELLRSLVAAGVHVDLVSGEPEALASSGVLHHLEGLPMLAVSPPRVVRTSQWLKRGGDLLLSAAALAILSPVIAVIALLIKIDSPGPVIFRQRRVGLHGASFDVSKFRTMYADADARKADVASLNMHGGGGREMFKIPNDPRVTAFGKLLRRWSIDELPQLWNVLKGQMSLVGPRPLIPEEADRIHGHYVARLNMRPGITGPWQTQGRSDIPFDDMLKLDYTYAMTWTLREDARLMIRTISAVAKAKGAY